MRKNIFVKTFSMILALLLSIAIVPFSTIPSNAASYTYDPDAAIAYAKNHCATDKEAGTGKCTQIGAGNSPWLCAEFIYNCLKAGGFTISGYTSQVNAKAQGEYLQKYGTRINGTVSGEYMNLSHFSGNLQKGDIICIVYNDTVSSSGHVLLYSGDTDSNGRLKFYAHNSLKNNEIYKLTGDYLAATSEVYAIRLVETIASTQSTAAQLFVDAALEKVDSTFADGFCLRFVAQLYQSVFGGTYTSSCCAYKHGNTYIDSTSRNNIPLGACVFFAGSTKVCTNGCKNNCGHIGIYVGNNYIVHGWGGKIVKTTIDYVIDRDYPYRGWGWQANVSLDSIQATDPCNPDSYPVLERDLVSTVTGDDVKWLQAILLHNGYTIDVDGSYGPASKAVVKQFQGANGLTVDGQVGPATRAKLKEVWASKGHTWNNGTVVTPATHTTTGIQSHKCTYCSATTTVAIPKISDHTFDGGWHYHDTSGHISTCACGEYIIYPHTWDRVDITTAVTCTVDGIKTYTCTGCYATKTESIPASGHQYGNWQYYDVSGHIQSCACGAYNLYPHTWDKVEIPTAATCTVDGVKTYTCTGCYATKTETIPAMGHTYGDWQLYTAEQHRRACNNCNSNEYAQHPFGKWQNHSQTQHTRQCVCGYSDYAHHAWDNGVITKPATSNEEGIKTHTCTDCSATKTETIPILEENHIWNDGEITEYPDTCLGEGTKTYTCTECGKTKNVTVTFISHRYQGWEKIDDTYHKRACLCGEEEEIVAHEWDDGTITRPSTPTQEGEMLFHCSTCGGDKTETLPIITLSGDVNGDGVCTEDDTALMMQYFAGWDVTLNESALDGNGDGKCNNKDVTRLLQYLAGWDVKLA